MAPELFDPLLDLALSVAKKGKKAKPPIAPPARLVPMLSFAKLPDRAKDDMLDVIDTDEEFRMRVAAAATEKSIGRTGLAFVERRDGWREFVDQMVEVASEPIASASGSTKKLEHQLEVAERARQRAESDAGDLREQQAHAQAEVERLAEQLASAEDQLGQVRAENEQLVEQRHRAIGELKRTEEVMARHVAERKRLESLVEMMTAAQLSTSTVGGGATDEEVRLAVDSVEMSMAAIKQQLDALRRAATPEQIAVTRRVSLPVPLGLLDDSIEYAEYLLQVPNMTVLIDGYNVTKSAHGEWDLDKQRDWLRNGLRALQTRTSARFDVIFDGADVITGATHDRSDGVRVRFSPAGVEADDVIIEMVRSIDRTRPLTVVSSDGRVRDGAAASGANLLYSRQLIELIAP